jgi:Fe-S cluster assembly protein SufD
MNNIILNQSKDSNIKQSSIYLSSGFMRTDIKNNLNEEGSSSLIDGLFLGKDNQFIDNNIIINHNIERTYSKVLYKGVLDDSSHAVFNGLVNVPFKSKEINSDQKNHNILLSKKAKINSNPKLKISCDDVKCSHGSTIGNLDSDSLFYLRSRGIDLKKSKKILLNSFINEIIDNVPFDGIIDYINSRIDELT